MKYPDFEQALTGGHPNSLGNTIGVVEEVLSHTDRLEELFNCYGSNNEVVRLRVSNAMKRLAAAKKELLLPYLDRFLDEIGQLNQASAQWTLAQLFDVYCHDFTPEQKIRATAILKRNLENHDDWIVLNQTMKTLGRWAKRDTDLKRWLIPQLNRHASDERKSVSKTASKTLDSLA